MTAGESQAFTVIAYNDEGQELEVTCQATFFIVAEAGGSWNGNEYTAENAGSWRIQVEYLPPVYGCVVWDAIATLIVEAGAEETAAVETQEITPIGTDTEPKWLPIPISESVLPEG